MRRRTTGAASASAFRVRLPGPMYPARTYLTHGGPMRRDASLVVLLLLGSAPALTGQEATDRERIATVTAGIGNTMGWLGVQGERYFAHERLSAFLGLGYTPSIN